MIITAAELMATEFGPPTAAELVDLVDTGACTPQCLFGLPHSDCQCRCGEQFHGAARHASPTLLPPPYTCECVMAGPVDQFDQSIRMFSTPTHWTRSDGMVTAHYTCSRCGDEWSVEWPWHRMISLPEYSRWASETIGEWRAAAADQARRFNRAAG